VVIFAFIIVVPLTVKSLTPSRVIFAALILLPVIPNDESRAALSFKIKSPVTVTVVSTSCILPLLPVSRVIFTNVLFVLLNRIDPVPLVINVMPDKLVLWASLM